MQISPRKLEMIENTFLDVDSNELVIIKLHCVCCFCAIPDDVGGNSGKILVVFGNHNECQEMNLGLQHAGQMPYPLTLQSFTFLFGGEEWVTPDSAQG